MATRGTGSGNFPFPGTMIARRRIATRRRRWRWSDGYSILMDAGGLRWPAWDLPCSRTLYWSLTWDIHTVRMGRESRDESATAAPARSKRVVERASIYAKFTTWFSITVRPTVS